MTMLRFSLGRALLGTALALLLVPAAASAAPDRATTLSASAAEFAWDGPPGTGAMTPFDDYSVETCSKEEVNYCDQTLLKIESGGPVTLDVDIADFDPQQSDFDLYVYKSNEAGTATDDDNVTKSRYPEPTGFEPGSTGLPNGLEEGTTIEELEPGYYLVVVVYYETTDGTYKGTATVTGATPVPGGGGTTTPPPSGGGGGGGGTTPPPTTTPAPPQRTALPFRAASKIGSARKARKTRSFTFSATADETISGLTVQLLSGKSGTKQKVIGVARVATFEKGTRKIKLKLSKRTAKKLKKGRYTLASRGTVDGQALQIVQGVAVRK